MRLNVTSGLVSASVALPGPADMQTYSLPHPLGPNKTVLLLYKLLPKVLPVTTFHVCNSAILFHFILCLYVVRIELCNFHELYLYLCFILVVFYTVFLYSVSL